MLETNVEPAAVEDEAAAVLNEAAVQARGEGELTDEELADEVIVEVSVDGMCGVY